MKESVVIIGAGPAGLTAGYELLMRCGTQYDIIIVEKDNQVGGLAKTVHNTGFSMDIGGHRYFSKNEKIVDWWKSVLPPEDFLLVSRFSKIFYKGNFIDYPISFTKRTMQSIGLAQGLEIAASYLKAQINRNEESTLAGFYRNRFGEKLYRMFFRDYTKKVWGRMAEEIPSEWGCQRVKGVSVSKVLANALKRSGGQDREISLTDFFYYPIYGSGYLWDCVAEKIRNCGGSILLSEQVTEIAIERDTVTEVRCGSGRIFYPKYVVSSMPLRDFVLSSKNIPAQISEIASNLEYRGFVAVGLQVEKDSLIGTSVYQQKNGMIPDQWLYIQDSFIKAGRLQLLDNWSPRLQEKNTECICMTLEYFCQENDDDWNRHDKEWIELATIELKQVLCEPGISIRSAKVVKAGNAYPCYWGSYQDLPQLREYCDSIENLLCIGRNGQHRYNNIDHAMETGMRAADYIYGKGNKRDIWSVNTEKTYHEA